MATTTVAASSASRFLDPVVLAQLGAGLGGRGGKPPHQPRRLEHPVLGMEERAREPPRQGLGELIAPVGCEAVLAQRLVLGAQLVPLVVTREPQASCPPEGVAAELGHPVDVRLGQPPVVGRPLAAEPLARAVVCHRATAKRKPAVAAAGAGGDLARLMKAHAQAGARERERARAARDAAADDLHVGRPGKGTRREGRGGLREPVGVGHGAMLATRAGDPQ